MRIAEQTKRLSKRIGRAYDAAAECREILDRQIDPPAEGIGRVYKQAALDLLKMAMNALDEAAGYVEDIR